MVPTPEHKAWAQVLWSRAPLDTAVHQHWDDPHTHSIHVFSGRLEANVLSKEQADLLASFGGDIPSRVEYLAATVGLMDVDQGRQGRPSIHTEVLMERHGSSACLANIIATIAFYSIKDRWKIAPDTIFEELVRFYIPGTKLPHVMFVPIFRWDDMARVTVATKTIYPLLAVPISEGEARFVGKKGAGPLMQRWETLQTSIHNWERDSVA